MIIVNGYLEFNRSEEDVERMLQSYNKQFALISDETCFVFKWIIMGVFGVAVNSLGAVTNIINIICFVKEGLKDSVNVNFLGLAIADLGALVTMLFVSICFIPTLQESVPSVDFFDLMYLTAAWPHNVFIRVGSWIMAVITLERCLCITMPLKVKLFLTAEKAALIIACLYIIVIGGVLPVYYVNSYGWKFSPERNRTIFGLLFSSMKDEVEQFTYALNNVVLPFMAFIVVIVCTATLVMGLRKKSEWREKSTYGVQAHNFSSRDQKVSRLTVVIAAIFIGSYIPICVTCIAMICVPGLTLDGHNKNVIIVCGSIGCLLEGINSSVNIFVYYHMSSKYRQTFSKLFYCFHCTTVIKSRSMC